MGNRKQEVHAKGRERKRTRDGHGELSKGLGGQKGGERADKKGRKGSLEDVTSCDDRGGGRTE